MVHGTLPLVVHNCLAGDYGAGARKIWRSAQAQGIRLTLEQAKEIWQAQRDVHKGVFVDFDQALERELHARGGWILTGLGFPNPIWMDRARDKINRCVQRTGHDVHVIFLYILSQALEREGIKAHGIVWDFHDQYIIQIDRRHAEKALKVHAECVDELNEVLGATVRLKYGPRIVHSMSEAKMEEDWAKREQRSTDSGTK